MINSYVKFKLVELNKIKALVFTATPRQTETKFTLFKEGSVPTALKVIKSTSMNYITIYELELPTPYEFGKTYAITLSNFTNQVVDLSDVPSFKEFDKLFNYDGDDLGATYSKESTSFALWAPLATEVVLKIKDQNGNNLAYHHMHRTDKGVYRITLDGDYLNYKYVYRVTNNGVTNECTDPYGKGASENSGCSGVVDINAIKNMGNVTPTNPIENYVDASIYEVGIRDFTEQNHEATDIVNRGKYLGFVEEGRKTSKGHPAGLDYLVDLGITHVQLNPVIDFGTVDDIDVNKKYNWGYDPISMFALEGSYSLHPEIPMERLVEFKTMVNKLHEHNIRVILDVVYNHVYEYMSSCYEKIVPNYYFRRRTDGIIANASGCGDDVASERYMVSKMIQDSMRYFVEVFDVDGYRFDLMGLVDIHTLKGGYRKCKFIKEDIMVYGEGWNMGVELPYEERGCSDNADKLPMYGFFNDSYRDIIKGPTFKDRITQKGYVNGDINYSFGLKYIIYGSTQNVSYDPRFKDANQSINYAECHDNNTLYDKLKFSNPDEDEETLLKRVQLANGIISSSFGVPFYHMGQEIGLSKNGNDNTYNVLNINKMDWHLVDERYDMVTNFKANIQGRKDISLYRLHKREDLKNAIEILDLDNGLFAYKCTKSQYIRGFEKYLVIYNTLNKMVSYELDDDYIVIYHGNGLDPHSKLKAKIVMVPPVSMLVLVKKKNDDQI